jgi:hypothetical protein
VKTYLSGPITDTPDWAARFARAERAVRSAGLYPVNPARLGEVPGWTWAHYLRVDLHLLARCEAIVRLDGWERSRGARVELAAAIGWGLRVMRVGSLRH